MTAGKRFDVDCELEYELADTCDFLFLLHAAQGVDQRVLEESFEISPAITTRLHEDPFVHHRFLRLRAPKGVLKLRYRAQVERLPQAVDTEASECAIDDIPDDLIHNLMPTRYCESDHLSRTAQKLFGDLPPGHARVQAITDWIFENVDYQIGSTNAFTTARDVYLQRAGVCRDFAHLGATFCRALNIPARLVVGYAIFKDPPPDFHAVFEAYLGGRWVMFDPTRMSPVEDLVRIATGRDAKDVAFATIFGPATMTRMSPDVRLV